MREHALLKKPWYLVNLTGVWQFMGSKHKVLSPATQAVHGAFFAKFFFSWPDRCARQIELKSLPIAN